MQYPKFITILFLFLISATFCFSQDVTLISQAEVDAFDPNTTTISGSLMIGPEVGAGNITDLSNLSNLASIDGVLYIRNNSILPNVDGLSSLTSIGFDCRITSNNVLSNLDGLSSLTSVGSHFFIEDNNALLNVDGCSNLTSIGLDLLLDSNGSLSNVDGFSNLTSIGQNLAIVSNNALLNVDGFSNLTSTIYTLTIDNNQVLSNVNGFSNLTYVNRLRLTNNNTLSNVNGFSNVVFSINNYLYIESNNALLNLDGFTNLISIRELIINDNGALVNVDGLSNLTSIDQFLELTNNNALLNVDGFSNLTSIGTYLYLEQNDALLNVDGFSNLTYVAQDLHISNNNALLNLNGFSNTTFIGKDLYVKSNSSLLNVDGFSSLTSIGASIRIENNPLITNIDGLSNLTSLDNITNTVYVESIIRNNSALTNIDGLSNLSSIRTNLLISSNPALIHIDGLSNIDSIVGFLTITNNPSISNIDALSNLTSIAKLSISDNSSLININGLSNLTFIESHLSISNNSSLTNINGLYNLTFVGSDFRIENNPMLNDCCAIQVLLVTPNAIEGNITIENNLTSCDSQSEILNEDCGNNINIIEGNVFLDYDSNCSFDQGDIPYQGIIVQASSPEYSYSTTTDSLGDYKIYLDTGSYEVKAYMFNPYTQTCTTVFPIDILDNTVSDSFNLDFPTIVNTYCPYLEVDISTWALRECFDNNYYVQYCNSGTIDAADSYIEIELDNILSIAGSSIPFTGPDINNVYTFDIGTVNIGDCGNFNINVHLPCDPLNAGQFQGQTFCVDAHIYPDSICLPPLDIWDGSSVQVIGECDQDSVRFRVTNAGSGDMLSDKTLQVFEDQIMFLNNPFQLQSGEEMILSYFANGSTYRLEAEQSDGHPGNSNPSVAVEGCGAGPIFSLGFINQFSQDDGDVFVSSECREVTGSYDPNDKQGFPVGYGEEHFIEKNTDIEYLIRFQNTGTDTAFTVVITDEISPLFDITTIQPGASSHPYVFEIDSVVRFTFNNILLVDSLTNEAESHGFVKFRISQQDDLPNGTLLENTAEIYFDFNAPIITNTAFHTIGENFVTINLINEIESLVQISSIKAYPNPFSDVIHFELNGNVFEDIILSVYDVNGRKVASKNYHSGTFQFSREDLNSGVYFYTISSEGIDIANGKMILR